MGRNRELVRIVLFSVFLSCFVSFALALATGSLTGQIISIYDYLIITGISTIVLAWLLFYLVKIGD